MTAFRASLSSLLLAKAVQGYKDDSYYNGGSGNPNVDSTMYWKDAKNVLQDISRFSGLYVQFHSCAWSPMVWDEVENDVDEDDYWYMGSMPPFGPNAAFSLYGNLKGDTFTGCDKSTFINSFYTSDGFTTFTNSMYYAGVSGFSYVGDDDDDGSSTLSAKCKGSYGVGCDANYGFVVQKYSGNLCDPQYTSKVLNTLSDLNSALSSAQCIQIYDSSGYSSNGDGEGGNNNGGNNNHNGNNNNGYYGTPLELLYYSNACSYQNFDGTCPDPYGKVAGYAKNFSKGISTMDMTDPYQKYHAQMKQAAGLLSGGTIMLAMGVVIILYELFCRRKDQPRRFTSSKKKLDLDEEGLDDSFSGAAPSTPPTIVIKASAAMKTLKDMFKRTEEPKLDEPDGIHVENDGYVADLSDDPTPSVTESPSVGVLARLKAAKETISGKKSKSMEADEASVEIEVADDHSVQAQEEHNHFVCIDTCTHPEAVEPEQEEDHSKDYVTVTDDLVPQSSVGAVDEDFEDVGVSIQSAPSPLPEGADEQGLEDPVGLEHTLSDSKKALEEWEDEDDLDGKANGKRRGLFGKKGVHT